jgi:tRNA(Ile)-lysidine synthase
VTASLDPDPDLVARFAADLDSLVDPIGNVGIAVSGGADSLALLLLAAAARPGLVEAATVDHGLRRESRSEAEMVSLVCGRLGVPHRILSSDAEPPGSNIQAWARELRYALLGDWAEQRDLDAVATAHHLDDQAETLLMRLARGSGIGGLAGVQVSRPLTDRVGLVRPLLGWRRDELGRIIDRAGLEPVEDPSNSDERFDRSRARALLLSTEWLDPNRLAAVASHAIDAGTALDWAAQREFQKRHRRDGEVLILDPSDLPRELRRRLLVQAIDEFSEETPPGPKLVAALSTLESGGTTTLAGLKLEGGTAWRISRAPARRR